MKKLRIMVFLIILIVSFNTKATNGPLKQNSIIECNGTYYGKHGTPPHWHKAELKNNKWINVGDEVDLPSCYIRVPNTKEKVKFSKCSDGDTAWFIINGEEKKVRFLAIDTPETGGEKGVEKYGKEASNYTCNALKNAKEIYLEYDGASDKEDKYGRILAFVYVDNILLEKDLIEKGLAKVAYIYGDYEYVDELRETETKAKEQKIGIWEDDIELGDAISPNLSETNEVTDEEDKVVKIIEIIISFIKKLFALLFD